MDFHRSHLCRRNAGPWVYGASGPDDYDDDGSPYDQNGDAFNEPTPSEPVPEFITNI